MPYIKVKDRDYLEFDSIPSRTPGELNYLLTEILMRHHSNYDPVSYSHFAELIGALEACKLELYRRIVAPYEDEKILENGDVYE